MSRKAFMTWYPGIGYDGFPDENALFAAIASGVVFDTDGSLMPNPANPEVFNGYSKAVYLTRDSTYAGVKSAVESDLKELYGATTSIVWLDDKGLL